LCRGGIFPSRHRGIFGDNAMVKQTKINGVAKWCTVVVTVIVLIIAWVSTATAMKKDIEVNRASIIFMREDLKEIKQDIKELLRRRER
jgi:cell division protein FtsL